MILLEQDSGMGSVGFIGLGDQGLPMATAIAGAGFELHLWARRPGSLEPLAAVPHRVHATAEELSAVCDVVALCVSEDADVLDLVEHKLLPNLRPGAVVLNHGTGTPANARRLAELCGDRSVYCLDAPVSGGRPAAEKHELTTLVGGPTDVVEAVRELLAAFSAHVIHLGEVGSGQMAKLFNNAMLIVNQATIAELLDLAAQTGTDTARLVEALTKGSASSRALTLFGTMITPENVAHLSAVEDLDVDIFEAAMTDAGVAASAVVQRAHEGARSMADVLAHLQGGDR